MQIKRLRLTGFKSFVDPADLRIEPGLTGIVGPNGCGKSNLLEAIRWVMGEASAKSLRGGGMEDVIFAGTATRPARDFAEVLDPPEQPAIARTRIVRRSARRVPLSIRRDVAPGVALAFACRDRAHAPRWSAGDGSISLPSPRARAMLERRASRAPRSAEGAERAARHEATPRLDSHRRPESRAAALSASPPGRRYRELSDKIASPNADDLRRWCEAATAADAARGGGGRTLVARPRPARRPRSSRPQRNPRRHPRPIAPARDRATEAMHRLATLRSDRAPSSAASPNSGRRTPLADNRGREGRSPATRRSARPARRRSQPRCPIAETARDADARPACRSRTRRARREVALARRSPPRPPTPPRPESPKRARRRPRPLRPRLARCRPGGGESAR